MFVHRFAGAATAAGGAQHGAPWAAAPSQHGSPSSPKRQLHCVSSHMPQKLAPILGRKPLYGEARCHRPSSRRHPRRQRQRSGVRRAGVAAPSEVVITRSTAAALRARSAAEVTGTYALQQPGSGHAHSPREHMVHQPSSVAPASLDTSPPVHRMVAGALHTQSQAHHGGPPGATHAIGCGPVAARAAGRRAEGATGPPPLLTGSASSRFTAAARSAAIRSALQSPGSHRLHIGRRGFRCRGVSSGRPSASTCIRWYSRASSDVPGNSPTKSVAGSRQGGVQSQSQGSGRTSCGGAGASWPAIGCSAAFRSLYSAVYRAQQPLWLHLHKS